MAKNLIFWKIAYKKVQKWVKMSFPDHGVNRKLVDNVENYLNMQFQPKVMTRSPENGQKPIFWKIAYKQAMVYMDPPMDEDG